MRLEIRHTMFGDGLNVKVTPDDSDIEPFEESVTNIKYVKDKNGKIIKGHNGWYLRDGYEFDKHFEADIREIMSCIEENENKVEKCVEMFNDFSSNEMKEFFEKTQVTINGKINYKEFFIK